MKRLALLLLMLYAAYVHAQLFVSNNSFVYNKGNVVYSTGNIELNGANSYFYLRNEGQFLQGTSGVSANKGTGKLSVFQEGTVNNYAYNYWCSPVGNASTASGNEDFGITMLHLPTSNSTSIPATIANTTYDGFSSTGTLSIASYWIWKFLSSTTYAQWIQSASNTDISAGQGFTMKGTIGSDATDVGETAVNNPGSAQRYDFRGKPNDGDITVSVGANSFTLTGNPYPSALHVNAFLLDGANSACTGVAYYWEQNKAVNSHLLLNYQGGYGVYSPVGLASSGVYVPATFNTYNLDGTINTTGPSSGLVIERKYAPIGQGFMVKGNGVGGALTLKNAHRAYNIEGSYSQFERQVNPNQISEADVTASPNFVIETVSQLRLNTVLNNQFTKQIALAFVSNATDGVDRGIDAMSPEEDTLPNDVYFFLDNDKYVIQGVKFDINKRISIGIKSTNNTTFKFDASTIVNFDSTQAVYMYDAQDGSYHDIKNGTYEVTLPTGIYNNRFEITFKNSVVNLEVNDTAINGIVILHNHAAQQLIISNPNLIQLKSVKLYDLNGKLLFDKQQPAIQESYQFSTQELSEAVYLAEVLTNDNRKTVQKIIVSTK
ncbi:T9SS type A sorting domain-containing protein [Flavobacterium phycosphaerae]|uniref:T9SS type A sorting domain-containing protein n=1 Tax=Flavobacterium phycosphaerae TaxID=2697515 RepID=UPI001389F742|nr:T9SS type A sorting domain-containing protein [Flavobacterium phycosphaerae]